MADHRKVRDTSNTCTGSVPGPDGIPETAACRLWSDRPSRSNYSGRGSYLQRADRSGNDLVYRYADDILAGLPAGAVLISEGDDVVETIEVLPGEKPELEDADKAGIIDLVSGWLDFTKNTSKTRSIGNARKYTIATMFSGSGVNSFIPPSIGMFMIAFIIEKKTGVTIAMNM